MDETNDFYAENTENAEDTPFEEDRQPRRGGVDVPSFQTIVCLGLALGLVILNIFRPDIAADVLSRAKSLSSDTGYLYPNPIDLAIDLFRSL